MASVFKWGIEFPRSIIKQFGGPGLPDSDVPDAITYGDWNKLIDLKAIPDGNGNKAPGTFISARISKRGGIGTVKYPTTVLLAIEGKVIFRGSFERAKLMGLNNNNPYGVTLLKGFQAKGKIGKKKNIETLTISFIEPLYFKTKVELSVYVTDKWVNMLLGHFVYGGSNTSGGEDSSGSGGGDPFFPPED